MRKIKDLTNIQMTPEEFAKAAGVMTQSIIAERLAIRLPRKGFQTVVVLPRHVLQNLRDDSDMGRREIRYANNIRDGKMSSDAMAHLLKAVTTDSDRVWELNEKPDINAHPDVFKEVAATTLGHLTRMMEKIRSRDKAPRTRREFSGTRLHAT